MAHAPECSGSVYGCSECGRDGMTISESFTHAEDCHPEMIRVQVVAPDGSTTSVPMYPDLHPDERVGQRVRASYPNGAWGEGLLIDADETQTIYNRDTKRKNRRKAFVIRRDDGVLGFFNEEPEVVR